MSLNSQKTLGVKITTSSKEKILEYISKYLISSPESEVRNSKLAVKPLLIFTPNPEIVILAQKKSAFLVTLNQADVALPDGIGISLAAKIIGIRHQPSEDERSIRRIPGVEFMEDLIELSVDRGVSIGLIGGYDGLAVRALECLQARNKTVSGWASDGPILPPDGQIPQEAIKAVANKIEKQKTSMIFAGFGAPKQEFFLKALERELIHRSYRHPVVLMAVGGSFDILTGVVKRAPVLIRLIGFEWIWRLAQEPWRWRRQLALIQFVTLVIRQKLGVAE